MNNNIQSFGSVEKIRIIRKCKLPDAGLSGVYHIALVSNLDWLAKDSLSQDSRNVIGRNPSMVIPLLANQDLTPMLYCICRAILMLFYLL